jgi:integrase
LVDSDAGMIRGGFLSAEDRSKLIALARDGSAASRLTRRANALVLLDDGWSCRVIEEGAHLGYRKPKHGAGKWVWRRYLGGETYEVESIGAADDYSDADGVVILDYKQAQEELRKRMVERAHTAAGKTGPFTVNDAMEFYFAALQSQGRPEDAITDARYRCEAHIKPKLGDKEAGKVTKKMFTKWRDELVKSPPRLRTKPGEKQKFRKLDTSEEGLRRRQATANRIWTELRAALNAAFLDGKIASNSEWKNVEPFDSVDGVRVRYLSIAESKRLINAADPDFRLIVQAALATGARYGQLAKLTVGDFNPDAGTATMRTRKGKGKVKVHHVHLTSEGVEFFKAACLKRSGTGELIFTKADGEPWRASHQNRRIIERPSTPRSTRRCRSTFCGTRGRRSR